MEKSYVDILNELDAAVASDETMPGSVHAKADKLIDQLKDLLWAYSY